MGWKKWILLISIVLLVTVACEVEDPSSLPESAPEGTERFTPENIEKYGCPDKDKVPEWVEIPECVE
jgi:hypothetical protein